MRLARKGISNLLSVGYLNGDINEPRIIIQSKKLLSAHEHLERKQLSYSLSLAQGQHNQSGNA